MEQEQAQAYMTPRVTVEEITKDIAAKRRSVDDLPLEHKYPRSIRGCEKLMRDIHDYVNEVQERVSGDVPLKIRMHPYLYWVITKKDPPDDGQNRRVLCGLLLELAGMPVEYTLDPEEVPFAIVPA